MAELFGRMPYGDTDFFVVRRLDMQGSKPARPIPAINSRVHSFVFFTSGEALIIIGEESYFFRRGECAAIPAGQVFSIRYFDNCTGYMGAFSTDFINDTGINPLQAYGSLRRWGSHKVVFDEKHIAYVTGIFDRLVEEYNQGRNVKIIKAYLTALLTEIEEADTENADGSNDIYTENDICNRFLKQVFDKCDFRLSAGDYASGLNISRDYLQKTIRRFTGRTPLAWIHEAVITESKALLVNTGMSVNEVSSRVGVEDMAYFSRLFKKLTGVSPTQYRKEQKHKNTPG